MTARGFQDLSADSLDTYAGTASRWGQRLVCSICAQHGWSIFAWDVSTAFLQGVSFEELAEITGEEVRRVALIPPKGYEKYFKEIHGLESIDFSTHSLLMLKAVYG